MVSNHFPMIFANQYLWLVFAAIINVNNKTNDVIIHANQAFGIIRKHCNDCHSSFPINEDFDDIDQIRKNAEHIMIQAVKITAIPLGNPKHDIGREANIGRLV